MNRSRDTNRETPRSCAGGKLSLTPSQTPSLATSVACADEPHRAMLVRHKKRKTTEIVGLERQRMSQKGFTSSIDVSSTRPCSSRDLAAVRTPSGGAITWGGKEPPSSLGAPASKAKPPLHGAAVTAADPAAMPSSSPLLGLKKVKTPLTQCKSQPIMAIAMRRAACRPMIPGHAAAGAVKSPPSSSASADPSARRGANNWDKRVLLETSPAESLPSALLDEGSGGAVTQLRSRCSTTATTNGRGSTQSARCAVPLSNSFPCYRPDASSVSLPMQQLLEDGYYLASDESANSSFSDATPSERRTSQGRTYSLRLSSPLLGASSASSPATELMACGEPESSRDYCEIVKDGSKCSAGCHDEEAAAGFSEVDAVDFDEEAEAQAMLTYMDTGAGERCQDTLPIFDHSAAPLTPREPPLVGSGTLRSQGAMADCGMDAETCEAPGDIADNPSGRFIPHVPHLFPHRGVSSLHPPHHSMWGARAHSMPESHISHNGDAPRDTLCTIPGFPPPSSSLLRNETADATLSAFPRRHTAIAPPVGLRLQPHTAVSGGVPQLVSSPRLLSPNLTEEELREQQCRQLSLYEAFFSNQNRSAWLVDDNVLAKVLEYVQIMGYEHPALKRDRTRSLPSLWSSSSAVPSPIKKGKARKKLNRVSGAAMSSIAEVDAKVLVDSNVSLALPADGAAEAAARWGGAEGLSPAMNASESVPAKRYELKTVKPYCAGQYTSTPGPTPGAHFFLTFAEAMRWITAQEYVIGVALLCCACFVGDPDLDGAAIIGDGVADTAAWHPRRTMLQRGKPCIPMQCHPIHFVASLVCSRFPQRGNMKDFVQSWETQIRLVLGSSAPSHQRVFKFPQDDLLISSDCEGGNLHRVERAVEPYLFFLWLEADEGSDKRIWFRFSVSGAKEGQSLRFRLMNASPHTKLYRQNGMTPVWRDGLSQPHWRPVNACSFRTTNQDTQGELSFSVEVQNSTDTIQVAFCVPYTYSDLLCHICHWHALAKMSECDIRFDELILCHSPEGRKLHQLMVTSGTGVTSDGKREDSDAARKCDHSGGDDAASPFSEVRGDRVLSTGTSEVVLPPAQGGSGGGAVSCSAVPILAGAPTSDMPGEKAKVGAIKPAAVRSPFSNFDTRKKIVLVSGRVHAGEVTASHGVHGLVSFLLSSDARAVQLREHFIFFIVPMLNPDGVSRGQSRMDQYGNNLNRCYNDPDAVTQPTVLALRRVFERLQHMYGERLMMYLDFHSHASQSKAFMFGNNLPAHVQHWNLFFPLLVELHARRVFSFDLCRFGRVHMTTKDGASRVLFGGHLVHSYTVELTHFTDGRLYADDYTTMNSGCCVPSATEGPPTRSSEGPARVSSGGSAVGGTPTANHIGAVEGGSSAWPLSGRVPAATAKTRKGGQRQGSSKSGTERTRRVNSESAADGGSVGAPTSQQFLTPVPRLSWQGDPTKAPDRRGCFTAAFPPDGKTAQYRLQPISFPCVLCQSADVGRACLLALRDYCSIGAQPSSELAAFGGMARALKEVKLLVRLDLAKKNKITPLNATHTGANCT